MMRLPPFRYVAATSVDEAARVLGSEGPSAMAVAGGTDLYPKMKRRQFEPKVVVGLRGIAELRGVTASGGMTQIGALTSLADLQADTALLAAHPVIASAARVISTPILQNMGTIGGNLLVDTRCNYYDMPLPWRQAVNYCLKKDGDICLTAPGSPRCWAISSTDLAPVLWALGATVTLAGPTGTREIPVSALYGSDGIAYLRKKPDEILTDVRVPAAKGRATYWKLRRRGSFDFPILGVAVRLELDGDVCRDARVVLGAVESFPIEVTEASEILRGQKLTEELLLAAAAPAVSRAKPLHNADLSSLWRKGMVRTYVVGALREAAGLPPRVLV